MAALRLHIDGESFRDPENRQVILHGINIAGDSKFPHSPDVPSHVSEHFYDGDDVSFVNRPFSESEADSHFSRLRSWGFNTLRYIFTWEALEHAGPGEYDDNFIDHTIALLRKAKEHGFYVFMDPHQDVWSRFTGGSGAPLWTIYACGLDPKHFQATEAALVQNTWPDPASFPKMVWATNYTRLAVQTISTLFFAGRDFAPKCIIDGKNIQDYLQGHFVDACKHLAQRIHEAGDLHGEVVIGYETMNEPNKGYVGHPDLNAVPTDQKLRKSTSPTALQSFLTGSGRAVEVEVWNFGSLGPYKSGSQLVDPKGVSAWLDSDWADKKYGWERGSDWKLGTCIWAQHGIWDPKSGELLLPKYFTKLPQSTRDDKEAEIDQEYWTNNHFMHFYRLYRDAVREVWQDSFLLIQPSPFEIPPNIAGTPDGDDKNMIFASHFYDGITLIMKKWNKVWNVDVLGVLRGRYSNPAFAIKLGETAIRNCFRDQLREIRREGDQNMGIHPSLFTEIGIPYDMDDQHAYKTGDYSSQSAAIDANFFAVEGSGVSGSTWWVYTATNSHYWGDNWNGEDLSIYSTEDLPLPEPSASRSHLSADPHNPSYSASQSSLPITPSSLQKTLSVDAMTSDRLSSSSHGHHSAPHNQHQRSSSHTRTADDQPKKGYRAAEAYVRPVPISVHGTISTYGFDLRNCIFSLTLTATSATDKDFPTEVFLPAYHFPQSPGKTTVEVSGGKWEIGVVPVGDTAAGPTGASRQLLRWWHAEGEQKLVVHGVKRRRGQVGEANVKEGEGDGAGYVETLFRMFGARG
jgi:hypothetical protein